MGSILITGKIKEDIERFKVRYFSDDTDQENSYLVRIEEGAFKVIVGTLPESFFTPAVNIEESLWGDCMVVDTEKLLETRSIIIKLANGINPVDDSPIIEESFLNNPKIVRSLYYLNHYITDQIEQKTLSKRKPTKFLITEEQLENIRLPSEKIGINEFAKAINNVIDQRVSKKVTGQVINKKLKELGILSEMIDEEGKVITITNENSEGYGIESIARSFNGREYQKIVYNDVGKEFLLRNIVKLLE